MKKYEENIGKWKNRKNENNEKLRGVDTGSSQLRLFRGSSQSACCMVSGTSSVLIFLDRNRFLSLVKWLDDTLKITVGHRCTCADDTRTTTTTEIVFLYIYIYTD